MSISLFPETLFQDFPISTIKNTTNDATHWVLNIGGVPTNNSLGIQIPIFVIILGIIGAYIRYLYLGIPEHKNKLGEMLFKLENLYRRLDDAKKELKIAQGDPKNNKLMPPSTLKSLNDLVYPYISKKNRIESKYNEFQYKVNFETVSHVLHTVGFFLLAPLLSIMGWLILSIGGTENHLTFALVSITAGFTAKSIIEKALSLVDTTFSTIGKKNDPPSISIKPRKGKVGSNITITGKKFKLNSDIQVSFDSDDLELNIETDSKGSFTKQIQVPDLEPGLYDVSVKDDLENNTEKEFEILE